MVGTLIDINFRDRNVGNETVMRYRNRDNWVKNIRHIKGSKTKNDKYFDRHKF